MLFDDTLNKFIFVGITHNNVGKHLVGVELVSSLDPTLTRKYYFTVTVADITTHVIDLTKENTAVWNYTIKYNVATKPYHAGYVAPP